MCCHKVERPAAKTTTPHCALHVTEQSSVPFMYSEARQTKPCILHMYVTEVCPAQLLPHVSSVYIYTGSVYLLCTTSVYCGLGYILCTMSVK